MKNNKTFLIKVLMVFNLLFIALTMLLLISGSKLSIVFITLFIAIAINLISLFLLIMKYIKDRK
jgi:hypothetical protein